MITHYSDLDILKEKLLEMKQANINQIVYGQVDEKEATKLKGAVVAIDTVLELSKKILEEKEKSFKDATLGVEYLNYTDRGIIGGLRSERER